jgi:hypothetical protein
MRSFRKRPKYGNNQVAQENQEKIEGIGNGEVLGECDTRFGGADGFAINMEDD